MKNKNINNHIKEFYEKLSQEGSYSPRSRLKIKAESFWSSVDDRLEEVSFSLNKYLKNTRNKTILDIGCGDGIYESLLERYILDNNYFIGLDISEKQLKKAQNYFQKFVSCNIDFERLPFRDKSIDCVIFSEILEHVFHPEYVILEIARVLKKNGLLFFTCPNLSHLDVRLSMFFYGTSGHIDYEKNKEHIRFYSFKTLKKMFEDFNVVEYRGVGPLALPKIFVSWRIPLPRFIQKFFNRFIKKYSAGTFIIFRKI